MSPAHAHTAEALIERRGQCTTLANVLLLTQKMLELAGEGDWDTVGNLEADRRALLHECFSSPVPPEHSELFAEALAAMLHMNEELLGSVESAKAEVAAQQLGQVRTRQGINTYLDVEPLG